MGAPGIEVQASSEIEQVLEFLVQGDTDDKGELGRGAELARLDGADRVAGHAHHLGKLRL